MRFFRQVVICFMVSLGGSAYGATPPTNLKDADKILETIRPSIQELKPKVSEKTPIYIEKQKAVKREGEQKVFVKRFEFIGNTMINDDDLTEVIVNEAWKELTFTQIDTVVNKISEFYQSKGYISSYAFLPAQEIDRGIVIIEIFEGKLGEIIVDDLNGSARWYSKEIVNNSLQEKIRQGAVLNGKTLEERLLLINDTPGFSAVSYVKAGKNKGESDLVVALEEKISVGTSIYLDNYNTKNVIIFPSGKQALENLIGSTYFVNLFGVGDTLSFFTLPKRDGTTFYRGSVGMPVNADMDRVTASFSSMSYRPEDVASKTWGVNGSSKSASLSYNMPIIRQAGENMNLVLSTSYSNNIDKYDEVCSIDPADPLCRKEKTTYTASAGLSYAKNELLAKDSSTSVGLTVTVGDAELDKIQMQLDQAEAGPHITGTYIKINATASHTQAIDTFFSWNAYSSAQWSSKNNDAKFSITGPDAVKAYPSGDRSGDDGILSGISIMYSSSAPDLFINAFQISAFLDFGAIKAKKIFYSVDSKNVQSMSAVGIGLNAIFAGGIGVKSSIATRVFGPVPNSGGTSRLKFWTQIFKSFQI